MADYETVQLLANTDREINKGQILRNMGRSQKKNLTQMSVMTISCHIIS